MPMGKQPSEDRGFVGNRGILALLEKHPGQLVAEIAERADLAVSTVAHHLARLREWGQVAAEPEYLEVTIPSPRGDVKGKVRRLRWNATKRGLARLKFCRKRDAKDEA